MTLFPIVVSLVLILSPCNGRVKFTNLKCSILDKALAAMDFCILKSVNRTYQYASVGLTLYKPITNVWINAVVMKRANGYKPFLYNITMDVCKFMKQRNNIIGKFIFELFVQYTNMNHECPFNGKLYVEKMPASSMDNALTNVLPMPLGEYAIFFTWYINGTEVVKPTE